MVAFKGLRQEDLKFETSLEYIARFSPAKAKKIKVGATVKDESQSQEAAIPGLRRPDCSSAHIAGRSCVRGDITAATLHDDLFLVHYDCTQLESCLGTRVLRANLDPLLQHPLPAECQRVVKTKLAQVCR